MEMCASVSDLAAVVKLAIFDVDGVLTDGGLILGPNGQEFKNFHVRDGLGLVMLRSTGVELAIITGRESTVVTERMAALGIEHVLQGQSDKEQALDKLLDDLNVDVSTVCYVGDDLPDLPVMMRVGLSVAVADAHSELIKHAAWKTKAKGGAGAVREVCEMILAAQGNLSTAIKNFGSQGQ